ncbi:MAG TPA: phosphodiesterase [bacterium]|nr:phosphodiesterase [bacterium]
MKKINKGAEIMKIIIISDTHGSVGVWDKIKGYIDSDTTCIIHAGDLYSFGPRNPLPEGYDPGTLANQLNSIAVPLICSKGNCDSDVDQTISNFPLCNPFAFIFYDGLRIFITHGHLFNKEQLICLSKQWSIDLVVSGHTHVAGLESIGNTVFFNPGSCALPKNFPGIGLLYNRCLELYNLNDNSLVNKITLSR